MAVAPIIWDFVPENFVVFDLETTGLYAADCHILEIGAVKFNKQQYLKEGAVGSFQTYIKQESPIPKKITKLTGISDKTVKDGDNLSNALNDFLDFTEGGNLVAYNAKFDSSFLYEAARRTNIEIPKTMKIHCALELARERIYGVGNYKLGTIAKSLQIDTTKAHSAIHDCLMTLKIYLFCLSHPEGVTYNP